MVEMGAKYMREAEALVGGRNRRQGVGVCKQTGGGGGTSGSGQGMRGTRVRGQGAFPSAAAFHAAAVGGMNLR